MNGDLFSHDDVQKQRPLADRMRPAKIADFYGQQHILATGKPLREAIERGALHSMIFWGPPGTGKTTLAHIIACSNAAHFIKLSAVFSGVKEIRAAVAQAQQSAQQKTLLFIDEVHRFNKAQQDAFLPYVEDGTIVFIGATTENPSFELNNALLSRAKVYVLHALQEADILNIIERALRDDKLGVAQQGLQFSDAQKRLLAAQVDGDARRALNYVEICADLLAARNETQLSDALLKEVMRGHALRFDKGGEQFYDQISALHKSVRGSDPHAALYWMARMLEGGCDPLYIARRVVRMASEDIGLADPRALQLAMNAWDVQTRLGSPEGELALAQAVVYLACAPKSNALYRAFNEVMADVKQSSSLPVPLHLRNAPTELMKELDYAKHYRYAHDEAHAYAAGEHYFPQQMKAKQYYQPTEHGLETKIKQRLEFLASLDRAAQQQD